MKRILLVILFLVVIIAIFYALLLLLSIKKTNSVHSNAVDKTVLQYTPTIAVPLLSSTIYPPISPVSGELLRFVNPTLSIIWEKVKPSEHYYNKPDYTMVKVSGIEQDGGVTYAKPALRNLSNGDYLSNNQWHIDNQIAADGPNGSEWGYSKTIQGKKQVIIFSYTNKSFVPPPAPTICPCRFFVSVFLSNPF